MPGCSYAPDVSSRSGHLAEDWDKPIPEGQWAEVLVSAIRADLAALRSPRVIKTLRDWRAALTNDDPATQREARRRLLAVGEALIGGPELPGGRTVDGSDDFTVDAFHRPRPATHSEDISEPTHARWSNVPMSRAPLISPAFDQDNEPPTAHIALPSPPPPSAPPPPPLDDAGHEEGTLDGVIPGEPDLILAHQHEKPTTHIPLPADLDLGGPEPKVEAVPPARAISKLAAEEGMALEGHAGPEEPEKEDLSSPSRLAPKPGIIRRRSGRNSASSRRPRAAMHHVRSLYNVLMPFAEELIPLAFERRSRRFWARWREVAGEHGVRRPFVEELLRTATDPQVMVAELIAEIHSVDPGSVSALIDRLEAPGPASDPRPVRPRSALVGEPVRAPDGGAD